MTIRDNVGILSGGRSGTVEHDGEGGLDLTITEQFARSMKLEDAMNSDNLICFEMNGERSSARPRLSRAADRARLVRRRQREVAQTHRGHRPSLRRPVHGARLRHHPGGRAASHWTFETVSHDRLKSAPAKVVRQRRPVHDLRRRLGSPHRRGRGEDRRRPVEAGRAGRSPPQGSPEARVRVEVLDPALAVAFAGRTLPSRPVPSTSTATYSPARRPVPGQQADVLGGQRPDHPSGPDPLTPPGSVSPHRSSIAYSVTQVSTPIQPTG